MGAETKLLTSIALLGILSLALLPIFSDEVFGQFPNNEAVLSPPPPFDDLHCYEIETEFGPEDEGPFEMVLEDQFEEAFHELEDIVAFCNPTNKEADEFEGSEITTDQHWSVYTITTTDTDFEVIATVVITDQFHPDGFEADVTNFAEILLVPAFKAFGDGEHPEEFEDFRDFHFKCYGLVDPEPINSDFSLADQFFESSYTELTPLVICNPVVKFLESESEPGVFDDPFGDNTIPDHYLCYEIEPLANIVPGEIEFIFIDQFIETDAEVTDDLFLCTVAQKTDIPPPVIGGFNVPIDKTALLLAGVQSISMWMIPVLVAGIGIGIFVIKRRK